MLSFKDGCRLQNLQPQMLVALEVAKEEFARYGLDTVVTSVNDSGHKSGSKHYSGSAMDFRTKHSGNLGRSITQAIHKKLYPLGFDVLFEYEGEPQEHIHIEYDPKN
jgi:hypothetical protein